MNGNVFVTYENSMRGNVTGIYVNKKLAQKEKEERGDLDAIDSFPLKGWKGSDFDYPIFDDCKYYTKHLNTIRELIAALYQIEDCSCGGLAHIVTDDNNIDDDDIQFIIDQTNHPENQDREELGLVKLIGEELLKLSIQQRALLFSSYYTAVLCDHDCKNCPVQKGIVEE